MKEKIVSKLIDRGEDLHVEFKAGRVPVDTVSKVVCGFLNSQGGELLIGVNDLGDVTGVPNVEDHILRLESELPKIISTLSLWSIEQLECQGKPVLLITVPEGLDKPYVSGGAIYIRHGVKTIAAKRDDISLLITKRSDSGKRWEREVPWGAELEDLDVELVTETMKLARDSKRWSGDDRDIASFLHDVGLLINGSITNAALILYGNSPARIYPQARVRLLGLPEGKTADYYSIDKLFEGSLIRTAIELPEVLSMYVGGIESSFDDDKWQRNDRENYPMSALREGIMNALVHRDYRQKGSTTISILPGALRISNPGGLPKELRIADLKREHPSIPQNPDIAHICFLHRLIEKVGRGTQRIVEDCKRSKLKAPQWKSSSLETTLTIFSTSSSARANDLNPRQFKMLEVLRGNEFVTVDDLTTDFRVTSRTIRSDLLGLVDSNLVEKIGAGPSTAYRLISSKSKF